MARRKLNTKFLALLIASVIIIGVGAIFARDIGRRLFKPTTNLITSGDAAWNAGNYADAAKFYGQAAGRDKTNIETQIKYIDAFDLTVQGDPDAYAKLRGFLSSVLVNDPKSLPALERMMKFQRTDVRSSPGNKPAVRFLQLTSDRILELDPKNRDAQDARISAVLEPFSRNLDVDPDDVERARDTAQSIFESDPTDADALRSVVLFRLIQAQQAAQSGNLADAKLQLEKATELVDLAIAQTPDSAGAWMARFNVLRSVAMLQQGQTPAQRATAFKPAEDALTKADELANPTGEFEEFMTIRQTALRVIETRDLKLAERRYRQLVTELPNDRQPRIMLADFLARQPARRDEAAKVLEAPFTPTRVLGAIDSRQQKLSQIIEAVKLCTIKLGALEIVADSTEREKRLGEIEQQYKSLMTNPDVATLMKPAVLRIEGGIALERGRINDSINTLDQALKLLNPDSPYALEQEMRNDVLLDYAQAQLRLGNTGRARPALTELIQRRPDNIVARATLVDVLINERNFDDAFKNVEPLHKALPDNPVIDRLWLRTLAMRQDQLAEAYVKLPETTREQRMMKLQAAGYAGKIDEITRVARLMTTDNPADIDAVSALAQSLLRADKRDEAVAVVNTALAISPDDKRLTGLRDSLGAQTNADQLALIDKQIEAIADPYQRLLTRADFLSQQGKVDDAVARLREAVKLAPNNPRGVDALFGFLLAQRKFDEAESLLPDLTRMDVDQTAGEIRRVQASVARASAETDEAKRKQLVTDALKKSSDVASQYREVGLASLIYAQLLQQTGSYAEAIEQYAQTLDKSPTNIDALRGTIECLLQTQRGVEAKRRIDEARKLAPADARLRQLELSYELTFGDPTRALDSLRESFEKNPADVQAWAQYGLALEATARKRAEAGDLAQSKQFDEQAVAHYEKAIAAFPDDVRYVGQYADVQRRLGNPTASEQSFEKLVALDKYKDQPEIVEQLSIQYVRSGKLADAERVLRDLIQRVSPAPVSSVLRLSAVCLQQNRFDDAMAVLSLRRDDPAVKQQRIEVLLSTNNLDAARAEIDAALADNPTPETFLAAAIAELRTGKPQQASGFLKRVLDARPDNPAALFYRAQVAMASAPPDLNAAKTDLLRVRELTPGNSEARIALAEVFIRQGDRNSAIGELERAWASNPNAKSVLMRLADLYGNTQPPMWNALQRIVDQTKTSAQLSADPDVKLLQANIFIARGDFEKSIAPARQALASSPSNPQLLQRYYDVLLRAKDYRTLLRESEPILQQDRGAWWLMRLRGLAHARLNDKPAARKEFDNALELVTAAKNPQATLEVAQAIAQSFDIVTAIADVESRIGGDAGMRLLVAQLQQQAGNTLASLDHLERLKTDRARLAPEQLRQLLQMLGVAYLQVNPQQAKLAREAYEELLKLTPDDILLLNNLAYVLTLPDSGATPADALVYSSQAYAKTENAQVTEITLYVWDTHGWVLVLNGKLDDGLAVLQKAAETARFPEVFLHLGDAYLRKNDTDSAQAALRRATTFIEERERQKQPMDAALRLRLTELMTKLTAATKAATPAG